MLSKSTLNMETKPEDLDYLLSLIDACSSIDVLFWGLVFFVWGRGGRDFHLKCTKTNVAEALLHSTKVYMEKDR